MKFSLRTLALGATMLIAGAMMAQTPETPTVTLKWLTHDLINAAGGANNNVRSGSGVNGIAYVSNRKAIWTYDGSEIKKLYENSGSLNAGFAVDDAGNIAIQPNWATSSSTWNKWRLISADGQTIKDITLTAPEGWTGNRQDLVGRAVGNFFSEEGGIFYFTANGAPGPIAIWIKNGEVYKIAKSTSKFTASTQNLSYANPRFSMIEMTEDNFANAFYYEATNTAFIQYAKYDEGYKPVNIPWPNINGKNGQNGFDVFELGGKRYAVHVFDESTNASWGSNFAIWNIDTKDVIFRSNYSIAAGTDGTLSGNGCSFVARKVSDTKVELYQCYCAGNKDDDNTNTHIHYAQNSFNALYEITIPEIDYTQWYVNVRGSFNGDQDNGVRCNAEGIATQLNLPIGTKGFKVKVWNGQDQWHSNGLALTQGTWISIPENVSGEMTIAGATESSCYNVEYNVKTNQIRVTEVVVEPVVTYDIWGNFGGTEWSSTTLTEDAGAWVVTGVETTKESNFGIRRLEDGTQKEWFSADGDGIINEAGTYACKSEGTNFTIPAGTYDFSFNPETMTLTVAGEFNGHIGAQDFTVYFNNGATGWEKVHCYVWNEGGNGLISWPGAEMTPGENNIWSYTFEAAKAPENVIFNNGNGQQTEDLVFENGNTYGADAPEPKTYSVVGSFNGWAIGAPAVMTRDENGIYSYTFTEELTIPIEFKIIEGEGAESWDVLTSYGAVFTGENEAGAEPVLISLDTENAAQLGSSHNFKFAPTDVAGLKDATISFWFEDGNAKVKLTGTLDQAGLSNVTIDGADAPVEYYNLQGVRVTNPTHGLYIRRCGSTTTKVML